MLEHCASDYLWIIWSNWSIYNLLFYQYVCNNKTTDTLFWLINDIKVYQYKVIRDFGLKNTNNSFLSYIVSIDNLKAAMPTL